MTDDCRQVAVDHLVVAGPTYELACEYVADQLGVPPESGGVHPGRGTRNALLGLGCGCYLEAIGPDPGQPDPVAPRAFGIDELSAPRLVTWALRTRDIGGTLGRLRSARFSPPSEMSRDLDDGTVLEWQLAFPRVSSDGPVVTVPFLIDWGRSVSPGLHLEHGAAIRSFEVTWSPEGEELLHCVAASDVGDQAHQIGQPATVDFAWCHRAQEAAQAPAHLVARITTKGGERVLSS